MRGILKRLGAIEARIAEHEVPKPTPVFVCPFLAGTKEAEQAFEAFRRKHPGAVVRVETVDARVPQ